MKDIMRSHTNSPLRKATPSVEQVCVHRQIKRLLASYLTAGIDSAINLRENRMCLQIPGQDKRKEERKPQEKERASTGKRKSKFWETIGQGKFSSGPTSRKTGTPDAKGSMRER